MPDRRAAEAVLAAETAQAERAALQESEADLMAMIADDSCGNGPQLTSFPLIREIKESEEG